MKRGFGRVARALPAVWCVLLLVAVAAGVVTRMSYTDVNAHPDELRDLIYSSGSYDWAYYEEQMGGQTGFDGKLGSDGGEGADGFAVADDESATDAAGTTDVAGAADSDVSAISSSSVSIAVGDPILDAPTVVAVRADGERRYVYKSFATPVLVTRVVRGDQALEGQRIDIYEPVGIRDWPQGRVLAADVAYLNGGVPMHQGEEYLLHVDEITPSLAGAPDGYLPVESPFAKLPLDDAFSASIEVRHDGYAITPFSEVEDNDIIVKDEDSLARYRAVREDVLARAGL